MRIGSLFSGAAATAAASALAAGVARISCRSPAGFARDDAAALSDLYRAGAVDGQDRQHAAQTPARPGRVRGCLTMRTATVYRKLARDLKPDIEKGNYAAPDEPQFELCVFTDGRVAQRWFGRGGSCVWWDNLKDLYCVHIYAHPDYGTRVEWSDGEVEQL